MCVAADSAIPEGETGGLLEPNSCQVIWTLKHDFIWPSLGRQTLHQKAHWQRTRQENCGLVLPWTRRDPGQLEIQSVWLPVWNRYMEISQWHASWDPIILQEFVVCVFPQLLIQQHCVANLKSLMKGIVDARVEWARNRGLKSQLLGTSAVAAALWHCHVNP